MDIGQLSAQAALLAGLVYGITDVIKNAFSMSGPQARLLSVAIGIAVGTVGHLTNYLQGHPVEQIALLVLAVIGGNLIHHLRPGTRPDSPGFAATTAIGNERSVAGPTGRY